MTGGIARFMLRSDTLTSLIDIKRKKRFPLLREGPNIVPKRQIIPVFPTRHLASNSDYGSLGLFLIDEVVRLTHTIGINLSPRRVTGRLGRSRVATYVVGVLDVRTVKGHRHDSVVCRQGCSRERNGYRPYLWEETYSVQD